MGRIIAAVLRRRGARIDISAGRALAFLDPARKLVVQGKPRAIERDVAEAAIADGPGPPAHAPALGRAGVEVARATPVAIARREVVGLEVPRLHAASSLLGALECSQVGLTRREQ